LLNKSWPPAFPPSQFLGSGFIPRSWENGKAGGQDLFNKASVLVKTSKKAGISRPNVV
jgi:hypothetical protein